MIPKDPVYPLTVAVERVKETILDQDAEGWLRNAIAADRITWAYVWITEDQYGSWPSPIDILPMVAIMEVPDLEIDWLKGTAAVRKRYKGVVEYPVVVSRRDLDRELANFTAPQETADLNNEPRKVGRPSTKREIEKAYKALSAAGEVDYNAPQNAVYEKIRSKVGPGREGFGDEAIRRVIKPLFDGDKELRGTL